MKACEYNCPIIRDYNTSIDNFSYYAEQAETAIERAESAELEATFRYVEIEEEALVSEGYPSSTQSKLLEVFGLLKDTAERMSQVAQEESLEEATSLREQIEVRSQEKADILNACNSEACALAAFKRETGSDIFACGSSNRYAIAMHSNLVSGAQQPAKKHS